MAKIVSRVSHSISRVIKGLVGIVLIPPAIGLALGIARQLSVVPAGRYSYSTWWHWGIVGYVGMHVLFYKPRALFRVHHAMLARVARWLFGGQVSTTEGGESKGKKSASKGKGQSGGEGSTLVVISPYLVPLYVVLISVLAWAASHWIASAWVTGVMVCLMGASVSFHLAMTAEDFQEDRERFPIELYVMAMAISSIVSFIVVSVCLPLVLPDFSMPGVFLDAASSAQTIYATVVQTLFGV